MFRRIIGFIFFLGVLNENFGGGLLGLVGVDVIGFELLVIFKGGIGIMWWFEKFRILVVIGLDSKVGLI